MVRASARLEVRDCIDRGRPFKLHAYPTDDLSCASTCSALLLQVAVSSFRKPAKGYNEDCTFDYECASDFCNLSGGFCDGKLQNTAYQVHANQAGSSAVEVLVQRTPVGTTNLLKALTPTMSL